MRLEQVTLRLDGVDVVRAVSGCFAPGSLTALVGPNGAGKTTLLRAIAGLHSPFSGRIKRGGLTPGRIALLPQSSHLDRSFPISCLDLVTLGALARIGPFGAAQNGEMNAAYKALQKVGLGQEAQRPIAALSAGQFQRVLFARLMVQDAPVILLDEPFTGVDGRTVRDLLGFMLDWHQQGRTMIGVLHDLTIVREVFPETLLLARDCIAWGPTLTVLTSANRERAGLREWAPAARAAA
ncbi:MAG: metal ABC transporter ATP-binding protein [Acetobacteraceae bacterium]|nr:metal ABC transporter ATP-binding protein [Acetobacteraceae bacterium]